VATVRAAAPSVTEPAPDNPAMVWVVVLPASERSSAAPAAIDTTEFGENALPVPACSTPPLIWVGPA
jgi:hypothetical protein